ncbi:MAG: hypothetical protein ACR2G6_06800 [Gemmatimonadaceae bacterium]
MRGLATILMLFPMLLPAQQAVGPLLHLNSGTPATSIVTAGEVRRACHNPDVSSNAQLATFCGLSKRPPAEWRLATVVVPSPDVIRSLAQPMDPEIDYDRIRDTLRADSPRPARAINLGAGLASQSTLLLGATDFLANKGRQQLRMSVVARFSGGVCRPDRLSPYLGSTCALVDSADWNVLLPGVVSLRTAVRTDLQRLPGVLVETTFVRASERLPSDAVDRVLVARYAARFLIDVVQGGDAPAAFARLAQLRPAIREALRFSADSTPAAAALYQAAVLLSALEERGAFRRAQWSDSSRRILYGMQAIAVNAKAAVPWTWPTAVTGACTDGDLCLGFDPARLFMVAQDFDTAVRIFQAKRDSVYDLIRNPNLTAEARRTIYPRVIASAADMLSLALRAAPESPRLENVAATIAHVQRIATYLGDEQYGTAMADVLQLTNALGLYTSLPPHAARIFSFTADVAQAEDAEGVEAAMSHFVSQSGGYRRKREPKTAGYVYLNAYAGAAAGRESACKRIRSCGDRASFAGAYVPIGVELGRSVPWGFVRSAGVFVQAIDVGGLASWRISADDSVASAPEVGVDQLFAPGVYAVAGIRGLPVSVGVGTSLAPKLRTITLNGQTEERDAFRRLSFFAALDIPLFP